MDFALELELVERDLVISDARFQRSAFEQERLNDHLHDKAFPQHIMESVLWQFRAFAEGACVRSTWRPFY